MKNSIEKDDELIADINIIPFVDIILVLLIVFMATAPVLIKEGVSVQLQAVSKGNKIKPSKLEITVHHTGDIFLKGQLTTLKDLAFYSKKVAENAGPFQAVITADISVSHGRVMEIIQTLKSSGVQQFIFSAKSR